MYYLECRTEYYLGEWERWLDGWVVRWLDGWVVGWLGRVVRVFWKIGVRVGAW